MQKMFLLSILLLLSACGSGSKLEGTYENQKDALEHISLTFKSNWTVTVTGKDGKAVEHQFKVVDDHVQIQNFAVPLTIFKDGSLDGNIFGTFTKK